jgi:hypothetical protein
MATRAESVTDFFDRYEAALLARDAKALATLYDVPSLILFPGRSVAVGEAAQTEAFFASAFAQYEGVTSVDRELAIIAEAPHSVWADVTWTFPNRPVERFCYQLVEGGDGFRIAVLTPLSVPPS